MDYSTPTSTSHMVTRKIWIFVGLLILATAFWVWTLRLEGNRAMQNGKVATNTQRAPIATDEQLNAELDSVMQPNTETDLKAIDNEFN